jgi:hypothetical protein
VEHRFEVQIRNRKEAKDLILAMARHGNHYWESEWGDLRTKQQVEAFFAAQGYNLADVIEECRDKETNVLLLENLIPSSGWGVTGGPGVTVSYTDSEGNEVVKFDGESGTFVEATDAALFDKAADDFERSIAKMSYVEFLSAIANGTASIEAYIFQKTYQYNIRNPSKELVDNKDNKVPFEDKIKKWVPTMAAKKLDLGGKNWPHFKQLKQVRDTEHTHTKSPALQISYRDLCKLLNLFRSGIAGLLLDLHVLFGDKTPAKVIKYAYHPDIKLVAELEETG